MTVSDTPPTPSTTDGRKSKSPSSSQNDWETSPVYLALSSRIAKTESALETLSAQVSRLSTMVENLVAPALSGGLATSVSAPAFVPLPDRAGTIGSSSSISGLADGDASIAALSQQISALSTSVAQLQRIQQHGSRPTSGGSGLNTPNPYTHQQAFPNQMTHSGRPYSSGKDGMPNGPLTSPLSFGSNGPTMVPNPLSPSIGVPNSKRDMMFPSRPNINRSISSSVVSAVDGDTKWGPPGPLQNANGNAGRGGPGNLQLAGLGLGAGQGSGIERVWSPGGMMTPSITVGNGSTGVGVQQQGGLATPGAGIVITKWDHLNLKPELLRSLSKYGIGPPNKIQARVLPFMLKGSDIIAQAPPTQERIISYVIPALQLCLTCPTPIAGQYRGPSVIIVTTTVDQATQCHKLVRNIGGPLNLRSALAAGAAGSSGLQAEIAAIQRDAVHILIGTPAKLNEVVTARGAAGGADCRLLILDEVDQLIARNLFENVLSIAKLLPPPRGSNGGALTPGGANGVQSPGAIGQGITSPYDVGASSPFNPASKTPFPQQANGSRFGAGASIERQTCIFSNTIPTDVITFSQTLNVRDPVRVLVRREGGPNSQESVSSVTPGINLKHTYVYLTITPSSRSEAPAPSADGNNPGTIGSGRTSATAAGGQGSEEATKAKEYKLDILGRMLEDYPLWQAIIHVGTFSMLEAVLYKLQSRNWETLYLTPDMPPQQKKAVLQSWRASLAGNGPRFLIVFDVNVKSPDIPWAPLVINFDLPRSVEGYAARAAAAVPPNNSNNAGGRNNGLGQGQGQGQSPVYGVIVSFVQAAGGDVEMLRSTECAYRFKSAEIPANFRDLFQH